MKRTILACMAAMLLCLPAQGRERTVTKTDSLGRVTRAVTLAVASIDTFNIQPYLDGFDSLDSLGAGEEGEDEEDSLFGGHWEGAARAYAAVVILVVFGTPLLIVALFLYFNSKRRHAEYRLLEKALENGQPLPESFFKDSETAIRDKGVRKIFLGAGLSILLWWCCDASLASVGLLVMFIGLGQVVIYRLHKREEGKGGGRP